MGQRSRAPRSQMAADPARARSRAAARPPLQFTRHGTRGHPLWNVPALGQRARNRAGQHRPDQHPARDASSRPPSLLPLPTIGDLSALDDAVDAAHRLHDGFVGAKEHLPVLGSDGLMRLSSTRPATEMVARAALRRSREGAIGGADRGPTRRMPAWGSSNTAACWEYARPAMVKSIASWSSRAGLSPTVSTATPTLARSCVQRPGARDYGPRASRRRANTASPTTRRPPSMRRRAWRIAHESTGLLLAARSRAIAIAAASESTTCPACHTMNRPGPRSCSAPKLRRKRPATGARSLALGAASTRRRSSHRVPAPSHRTQAGDRRVGRLHRALGAGDSGDPKFDELLDFALANRIPISRSLRTTSVSTTRSASTEALQPARRPKASFRTLAPSRSRSSSSDQNFISVSRSSQYSPRV